MSNIIVPGKPGRPIVIEATAQIPPGGSAGQVLLKTSGQDYATEWGAVVAGAAAWGEITGKPATFPPSAHTHTASEITDFAASVASLAPGTNLTYTASSRVIASDTGTDATLPLVTSGNAGLAPASGGGTANFLRADGTWAAPVASAPTESIIIAAGDETTAITAGAGKVTFRMPYAFTLSAVRASLKTAQASGAIFTVDINEGGTSILSTKLTIDNTERTSVTAATAAVISDTTLADDAEITIDVDQIGNGTAVGLKVTLIGSQP